MVVSSGLNSRWAMVRCIYIFRGVSRTVLKIPNENTRPSVHKNHVVLQESLELSYVWNQKYFPGSNFGCERANIMDMYQGISSHHRYASLPKYVYDTDLRRHKRRRTKANNRVTKLFHTNTSSRGLRDNSLLHLERSHTAIDLGIFTLNTWLHDGRVTEYDDG